MRPLAAAAVPAAATIAPPALAVVVPMLDEAAALPALLAHLATLAGAEILLVDGGSTDDSVAQVRAAGFRVVAGARGRARQMNAGAALTRAPILLFLHADTVLPAHACTLVRAALADGRRRWGRFDVRIAGRHPMLGVIAALMNRRSRWSGIATGDQAMFVHRAAFEAVGGFPDQPLMEDVELSKRLRTLSPPACIAARATTSGRRWESRGVWRTMLLMWRLRWAYWRGRPARALAKAYR